MRKSILSYISDIIYLSFVSGLAALILSRYYLGQGFASLIIAVCAAIATDCGYLAYKTKRQNKILFKKADEEKYTAFVTSLSVEREEDAANILFEALKKSGKSLTKSENSLKIDGVLTLCKITPEPLGANEAARLYSLTNKTEKTIIICSAFDENAKNFAANLGKDKLKLVALREIFPLIKDRIEVSPLKPKRRTPLKELIYATFSKKRARGFALYGVTMLIVSNFVFFPLWYILWGCAFILYSLAVKFFGKDEGTEKVFA